MLACLLVWSPTSYASSPALKIMLQDREGGKQVRKCYLNVMSLLLPVLLSQRVLACLQSRQPRFCRNRACRDTHPMQWATFQFWQEVSKLASSLLPLSEGDVLPIAPLLFSHVYISSLPSLSLQVPLSLLLTLFLVGMLYCVPEAAGGMADGA